MELGKIGKRFSASVMALVMALAGVGAVLEAPISTLAAGDPTPEAAFTTSDDAKGGLIITGYDEAKNTSHPNVVIPSIIGGTRITSIDYNAFKSKGLTSVEIPAGVTSIGSSAFAGNKLTTLTLHDGLTSIDASAFAGSSGTPTNQIQSLTIPSTVTSIGDSAFQYNKLTTLTLHDGLTSIGNMAFAGSSGTPTNQISSVEIPSTVKSIGDYAFEDNKLTKLTLHDGLASIGDSAFQDNKLTTLIIPNSVTSLSGFAGNQITSISIPASVTSIGSSAFRDNKLTTLTLHDGLTSIGMNAFSGNQLTTVEIPSTVKSIGDNAFVNNKLTTLTLHDGLASIGESAFSAGHSGTLTNQLTSVEIPSTVKSIGDYAFENNELTSVTMHDGLTSIGESAFQNNQLQSVKLPSSVTALGSHSFGTQTPTVPYRLENSKYTVKLPDDIDMSKITLKGSSYTLDIAKKEASTTDSTKPNLAYDYLVPYGTPEQIATMDVDATIGDREFTVTYLGKDGANTLRTEKVTENAKATPPTPPAVAGYTFTGWDKDITAPITKDTTFKALYTAVAKPKPAAGDFIYTAPTNLIYNKTPKTATVTARTATLNEIGAITIKYEKKTSGGSYDTPTSTAPINVGTYKVSIDVAGGTKYGNISGVTDNAWEFTISKATLTPDQPTLTAFEGQTLNDVVGSMVVTGGTWTWNGPGTTSVGAAGTRTFPATFTPTDANYNTVSDTLTVTVTTKIDPSDPSNPGDPSNPSDPGDPNDSWRPDGSWRPGGLKDFLDTGDVMTRYMMYGFAILLAVSVIGLCVIASKRKSK